MKAQTIRNRKVLAWLALMALLGSACNFAGLFPSEPTATPVATCSWI
jgi:hypothetical protein